jgi:hypothetical protein
MVIKPGFIETMDKHITKGRITTYTRVEPPIYEDLYPGKVLLDCGSDLESFDKEKFLDFNIEENLIDGGSQLFFGCMKEDYIGIDGYTFKMFCEDDDLHLRYKLAGFEHKVSSAHVYHFVSKTSRSGDYQDIELESNKKFIKKWGFRKPTYPVVYNKKCIITNGNSETNDAINLWFNDGEDIIVEIDGDTFTQQDYNYIQHLNDIVKETNELGTFELGNLKITINNLEEQQHKYINL